MSDQSKSKGKNAMHKQVKTARKMLGAKGLTQQALADLVGVHHTLISRRERGEVSVEGTTAEPLYALIEQLCLAGFKREVEETLQGMEQRSEERALIALVLLAFEVGRIDLVQGIMNGPSKAKKAHGFDPELSLRVLTVIRKNIEEQAIERQRDGDKYAGIFSQAARTFSGAESEMRLLGAALQDYEKSKGEGAEEQE